MTASYDAGQPLPYPAPAPDEGYITEDRTVLLKPLTDYRPALPYPPPWPAAPCPTPLTDEYERRLRYWVDLSVTPQQP